MGAESVWGVANRKRLKKTLTVCKSSSIPRAWLCENVWGSQILENRVHLVQAITDTPTPPVNIFLVKILGKRRKKKKRWLKEKEDCWLKFFGHLGKWPDYVTQAFCNVKSALKRAKSFSPCCWTEWRGITLVSHHKKTSALLSFRTSLATDWYNLLESTRKVILHNLGP